MPSINNLIGPSSQ